MRFGWVWLFVVGFTCSSAWAQSTEERNNDTLGFDSTNGNQQSANVDQVEQQIVQRTNAFRQEHGLEPVEVNQQLAEAANRFAQYMARTNRYGHTADGQRPAERAAQAGYEYCIVSENIAYQFSSRGFKTKELARKFVQGWIESPGHRKNMLEPYVTDIGVGVAQGENGYYYAVQMFGRPESLSIEFQVRNRSGETIRYTVGDRTYRLPPRYTRTHSRCRPADINFQLPDDETASRSAEDQTRYLIQDTDSGLQIRQQQVELSPMATGD